jgi:hypothetical protein
MPDALTAEREARLREVAQLRAEKDAWIARLERENEQLRKDIKQLKEIRDAILSKTQYD